MTLTLSVAAPAYNEAATIADTLDEWRRYLDGHPAFVDWEIVICDDGSTDGTGRLLAEQATVDRRIVVATLDRNRGAAAAIATAIAHTRHDWVVILDSDGQFPIRNLEQFLVPMATGTVAAFSGARRRKADSWPYRAGSAASSLVANLLLGTRYRDVNSIFKVVRGPLLRSLTLESGGMNCSTELTARIVEAGYSWVELPIDHRERGGGRRGWRFLRGAVDRALFVAHLGFRRWLLTRGVLRQPVPADAVRVDR